MDQTHDTAFDWTQFLDDGPSEPGTTVSPVDSTIQSPTVSRAAAKPTTPSSIPLTSEFATGSSSKSTTTNSSSSSSPSQNKNNGNKSKFPWWLLLLLLFILGGSSSAAMGFNPIYRALKVVGIEGSDGKDGNDGNDGQNGIDGQDGKDGTNGTSTAYSGGTVSGTQGTDGQDGKDGTNGSDGADGADGGDACISGICVSRQSTSPGTQETGNINIDGAMLAAQVGVNDTTPSNTLSVNGTADLGGHIAVGSGVTVDGGTTAFDALGGITAHSTAITSNEVITDFGVASTAHDTFLGFTNVNSSVDYAGQINGINGGVQIQSGNAQNYSGQLQGINGVTVHGGSGLVSTLNGIQGVTGNTGGGTIDYAQGLNLLLINLSGTINTNRSLRISTPINAGTVTNNYGLYIDDQKTGVGCTACYNLYSVGSSAINYFAGLVGIGDSSPTANLDILSTATTTNAQSIVADSLTSGSGLLLTSAATAFTSDLSKIELTGSDAANTGNVLKVGMTGASSTGVALNVTNAGSGLVARFNDDGTYTDSTPFVIDSAGYVGIGKDNPTDKLQVDGTIRAGKVFFRNIDNNDAYSYIMYDGADNMKYVAYDAHTFFTESGSGLTQRMIIDQNGNVGIGSDDTPDYLLDVQGTANVDGVLSVGSPNETIQGLGASDYLTFTKSNGRGFKFTGGYSGYSSGQYGFVIETTLPNNASEAGFVSIGAQSATGFHSGADYNVLDVGKNMTFDPSSDSYAFNGITVDTTINQTGSASGVTRGLYINPTLTAAADFRAIDIANDSGYGVYQSGSSALNRFNGEIQVRKGQTVVRGLSFYDDNFAIGMSGTDLAITTVSGSSNGISFTNNGVGGTPIMRIRGDGNVGIGESSPGVKLHITSTSDENVLRLQDSDGTCDHNPEAGSETVSCSSDARLKTDITDATSVLSEINGLKVHDYTIIASGKQTTGVIAQEVLETNPDMVHLGDDGYYKVDQYNIWKLVKGIQELSTNSDNLESTFTAALEETNGNVTAANEQIASLGLRVDELNQTLETYAQQLADHEQRIQSLEAKVEQLQAN